MNVATASPEHDVLVICQKGSDRDTPMPLVGLPETVRVHVLTLDTVTFLQPVFHVDACVLFMKLIGFLMEGDVYMLLKSPLTKFKFL